MSGEGERHRGLFGATSVGVGRILLLSVVRTPEEVPDQSHPALRDAQTILGESLQRGFERGTTAETLFTIAPDPWGRDRTSGASPQL